ncbi:Uncharacterized protein APZ42_000492 [Daphnia magna]|uniref:Uncharacterized protein n=1 Tax=Daphnia magna TaxID=35525 RepID=A0A162C9D5_9CRUS|nr:Uncharacterized protein APZ42_000492 [Daphnia magna]
MFLYASVSVYFAGAGMPTSMARSERSCCVSVAVLCDCWCWDANKHGQVRTVVVIRPFVVRCGNAGTGVFVVRCGNAGTGVNAVMRE